MLIEINSRDLATILAALRYWQDEIHHDDLFLECAKGEMPQFEDELPLNSDEIDDLCERINCSDVPNKYYVVVIKDKTDYDHHGPYATELEQAEAAVAIWKDCRWDHDVMLFLDVRGNANYCIIPRDFLQNPAEELTRLKAQMDKVEDELAKKLRLYVRNGGNHCPFCGDTDIVGDSYEHEEGFVTQDITCRACGKSWRDTLTLTNVTPLED